MRLKSKARQADEPPAERVHDTPVHQVDARHVDFQKVTVRRHSVIHQKAKVMKLRRIVYLRPMRRADRKKADAAEGINGQQHSEVRREAASGEDHSLDAWLSAGSVMDSTHSINGRIQGGILYDG